MVQPTDVAIANHVDERSYGLDAVPNMRLHNKAVAYIDRVCSERNLLTEDTRIFVTVQPDLDFLVEEHGFDGEINALCSPFKNDAGEYTAFVIYLSQKRYEEMGWQTYQLTVRHELAHVEANLRYGRRIKDGDKEFEMVCDWLDAPVTEADHEDYL